MWHPVQSGASLGICPSAGPFHLRQLLADLCAQVCAKLDGVTARSEDLERIVDDFETANAGEYLWDAAKAERSRGVAVDFFISVAFTAFFDGLERSYPILSPDDYSLTWRYLSQAGALAVDDS